MLLTLKEDNATGSLYVYRLLCMLNMIFMSDLICTGVHLYTIVLYTGGTVLYMCLCLLLANKCVIMHWLWCIYIQI